MAPAFDKLSPLAPANFSVVAPPLCNLDIMPAVTSVDIFLAGFYVVVSSEVGYSPALVKEP